jgi:hypothetical protein
MAVFQLFSHISAIDRLVTLDHSFANSSRTQDRVVLLDGAGKPASDYRFFLGSPAA